MRTATLLRTVKRLASRSGAGRCPACSGRPPVNLRDGEPAPPDCALCGRPPRVVRLVRDANFFRNQQRLEELQRHADSDR
jgi:hypothetical protein